ncbi:hypothetical protein LCGC14_2182340, partial [marine sediment metagenome]
MSNPERVRIYNLEVAFFCPTCGIECKPMNWKRLFEPFG